MKHAFLLLLMLLLATDMLVADIPPGPSPRRPFPRVPRIESETTAPQSVPLRFQAASDGAVVVTLPVSLVRQLAAQIPHDSNSAPSASLNGSSLSTWIAGLCLSAALVSAGFCLLRSRQRLVLIGTCGAACVLCVVGCHLLDRHEYAHHMYLSPTAESSGYEGSTRVQSASSDTIDVRLPEHVFQKLTATPANGKEGNP